MGGLYSYFYNCNKSRTAKLDKQEEAIIQCKITRDNIKAYIKRVERNERQRKDKAKEALREKNKDRARMYLQQAKLYREQVNVGNGQLTMIEDQIVQIESARQQKEALTVLEQGNKILKQLYEEVNIEKWEKIADDMDEIKQQQEEIGHFLKSHNIDQAEYDDAIDKELESLMKMESPSLDLPEAGKKEIETKEKDLLDLPDAGKKEIEIQEIENKEKALVEA